MGNETSSGGSGPAVLDDNAKQSLVERTKFPREEVEAIWNEYHKKKEIKNAKELVDIFDKLHLLDDIWTALSQMSSGGAAAEKKPSDEETQKIIHEALHDKKNTELRAVLGDQLFRSFDVDGNGRLSFDELLCGLSSLLHGDRTDQVKLLFRALDRDKSGFIERKELGQMWRFQASALRAGMVIGIHAQKAKMAAAGMKESDFASLIKVIDDYLKDPKVQEVFIECVLKNVDTDKDGKVSEAEYTAWYTSQTAQQEFREQLNKALQPYLAKMSQQLATELLKMVGRLIARR